MAQANKEGVIELLNEVLTAELTAINQYFLHAELCTHWGFPKLGGLIRQQSIGEMRHAETLMERILFLDGLPNVQRLGRLRIGENVREVFEHDLALEEEALPRLNDGIQLCQEARDNGSRQILMDILISEEEHIDWLDAQLKALKQVGDGAYLAQWIEQTAPE